MQTSPSPSSASDTCGFCGRDPYHYVDIGVGMEAVAVICCDEGAAASAKARTRTPKVERGTPASLLSVAMWNDRAAIRAKRKGDMKAAERHRKQAQQLRKEARQ